MEHPHLLHIFSPTKYVSPFDINMAYEARFDGVIPYCNVTLEEIHGLVQDTIFSRSPAGVRRTGIFIGGREFDLALTMLDAARKAMVPPFEVSVMADPSGAITTAAAMVALVAHALPGGAAHSLAGQQVCIFGGTGPVGMCVALLAARAGAEVALVSHQGAGAAQLIADRLARRHDISLRGVDGSSPAAIARWLPGMQVLFSAAKAGVQVIDAELLQTAAALEVVADANAVPPSGVAGVGVNDKRRALATAPGRHAAAIGALTIGDIKYRVHTALLTRMYSTEKPIYIAFEEAYACACDIVRERA